MPRPESLGIRGNLPPQLQPQGTVPTTRRYLQLQVTYNPRVPTNPGYLQPQGTYNPKVPTIPRYQPQGTYNTKVPTRLQAQGTYNPKVGNGYHVFSRAGTGNYTVKKKYNLDIKFFEASSVTFILCLSPHQTNFAEPAVNGSHLLFSARDSIKIMQIRKSLLVMCSCSHQNYADPAVTFT